VSEDNDLEAAMDAPDDPPEAVAADDTVDPSESFERDADTGFAVANGRSYGRHISDKTRELLRAAAAKTKTQMTEYGGDEEPALDAPTDSADSTPVQPAAKPASAAPSPSTAPAPSLDPAIAQERQRLAQMREELDQRTAKLAERETTGDLAKLADKYYADQGAAIVDLIKQWTGATTDDQVNTELGDLITVLSERLGVPLTAETKQALSGRRTLAQARRELAKVGAREREMQERSERDQQALGRQRAATAIGAELAKTEHTAKFPWLAAEDNAGQLVVDVYDHALKTEGKQLHWTEAAQRANDFLQRQATQWSAKRSHLLTTAKPAPAANGQRTPGAASGAAARAVITNAAASETGTSKKPNPSLVDGKFDMDAHRQASLRKLRAAAAQRNTDE